MDRHAVATHGSDQRGRHWLALVLAGLAVLGSGLSSCGQDAEAPGAGTTWCQDLDGTFHFRARVPPLKYRAEYQCTQGDYMSCLHWEPTGRYVFVVTDLPFVNWETELVSILYVEEEAGTAEALAAEELGEIRSNDKASLADPDDPIRMGETDSGAPYYEIFWSEVRGKEPKTYEWSRRDVFIQAGARVFHLSFLSVYGLDRPDFDEIVTTFQAGPAPDGGEDCPCLDEHPGEAVPCR